MNHPFGCDTSDLHLVVQKVTGVLIKLTTFRQDASTLFKSEFDPGKVAKRRYFLLLIINKRMRVTPSVPPIVKTRHVSFYQKILKGGRACSFLGDLPEIPLCLGSM